MWKKRARTYGEISFSDISTRDRLHSLRCVVPIRPSWGHRRSESPTWALLMISVRARLERSAPVCRDRSVSRRALYPRCVVYRRLSFFRLSRPRTRVFFLFIFPQRCLNEESSFPTQLSDSVSILPTSITLIYYSLLLVIWLRCCWLTLVICIPYTQQRNSVTAAVCLYTHLTARNTAGALHCLHAMPTVMSTFYPWFT